MAPDTAGIILAGGKSTRLGRDKASEILLERSLLQHVVDHLDGVLDEIVVVKAPGQDLPATVSTTPLRVVEDAFPGTGPLGGIYTGLIATEASACIAVACDMPVLQPALLLELLRLLPGYDLVAPIKESLPEPLCTAYAKSCIDTVRTKLEAGDYKASGYFDEVNALLLEPETWQRFDPHGLSFLNINREDELDRVRHVLESQGQGARVKGQD
jgi:molybdopterin-guanine dinucleotide biosynthesis protein A